MLSLDEIRKRLADRRLAVVAQAIGLSYATLLDLRDAQRPNPTLRTMELLSDYLERDA